MLVFGNKDNADAASACLALSYFLQNKQKQTEIACPNFSAPKNLKFLKELDRIKPALSRAQKFTIKLDVSHTQIDSLSYDVKDGWLSIYLTPKQGNIGKDDLRTAQSAYKYDLIITAGAADLNSLGEIFLNNTDLFYQAPIINLDYRANNEHFGQVNLVDLSCSSVSEVIYKILKPLNAAADKDTATALLTGMIAATHSFKSNNVTPFGLNVASELITNGANREDIIRHLYRTRSLATLKLWGYVLSGLKSDVGKKLVWTVITKENFIESGADEEDLSGVVNELINNSPEVDITVLLYESIKNNDVRAFIHTKKHYDAKRLLKPFDPEGDNRHAWCAIKNKNIQEAKQELLEYVRGTLN